MAQATDFKVLVLGGYGNFGRIIVQRLCAIAGIDVLIAGRDLVKAQVLAAETGGEAVRLDIDQADLPQRIAALGVSLVISTVGPFQGQDYRVARAAIAAKAHYCDLADGRQFVCGIGALDEEARREGLLVCSGASSVPALSAAVIDNLLLRFGQVESIEHGISSSEKTPGLSTVTAVLDYCGKPLRQWRDGRWSEAHGWQDLLSHDFPAPLGRRWLANCDIPDLELFPTRYPGVREVRFSAGMGLRVTTFGTWALSWLVRAGVLRHASPLAAVLRRGAVLLEPFGDGLSGMYIRLRGRDPLGQPLALCWEILARDNQGPNIPCLAAVALARKLAAGRLDVRGAQPCVGLLSEAEYLAELDGMSMEVRVRAE